MFHLGERAPIPHRLVRRIPGHTNAGGLCDSDSRQPFEEPPQPAALGRRVRDCRPCNRAALYALGRCTGVYATPSIIVGRHCFSGFYLPFARAGREVVVLSPARVAVSVYSTGHTYRQAEGDSIDDATSSPGTSESFEKQDPKI